MSKKTDEIMMLSEILTTALAGRPDLNKRLSSLLGTTPRSGKPGQEIELSHNERKQIARDMFTGLSIKQDLKKQIA